MPLPPLNEPTRTLFESILAQDAAGVHDALRQGADPRRLAPCAGISGGMPSLHAACLNRPDVSLPIVRALLKAGAPAEDRGPDSGVRGDALDLLCHGQAPTSLIPTLELLFDHGVRPSPRHLRAVIVSRWPTLQRLAALEALWSMLPETGRQLFCGSPVLAELLLAEEARHSGISDAARTLGTWLVDHGVRLEATAPARGNRPAGESAASVLGRLAPILRLDWTLREVHYSTWDTRPEAAVIAPWLVQAQAKARRLGNPDATVDLG
jgi:hypothetical protein